MSTVIIILLFLYSSYLTMEKYIVTGYIFRPRTSVKNKPDKTDGQDELPARESPQEQELIGASHFQVGQSPTPADYPGQAPHQAIQPADNGVTFTGQSDLPSSETASVGFRSQPEQHTKAPQQNLFSAQSNKTFPAAGTIPFRWTGQPLPGIADASLYGDDLPERNEVLGYTEREDPHRATGISFDDMEVVEKSLCSDTCTEGQKEQARGAFRRLEGTDMERLLRANILGSSEKLKRYMDLYIGQNNGCKPLTRKTKESILGIFDIEEYV